MARMRGWKGEREGGAVVHQGGSWGNTHTRRQVSPAAAARAPSHQTWPHHTPFAFGWLSSISPVKFQEQKTLFPVAP
jgi:hypothetical protein